ncbi:MAG: Fe-S cluster assembly protein SufD [Phycisphaerales bacterium]|jgi:Fe-S cluster assembly protein SufD|nr:Fe-S cluster assembly protein SufD [Phycisphaerales bacterium]
MTQLMEEKNVHLSNFHRFEKEANGDGATMPWLDELRKAGMARFDLVGFPAAKDENWRHTQLAPIVRTKFALAENDVNDAVLDAIKDFGFDREAISELVFVNGHYNAQLSKLGKLPRGVVVNSLAKALETEGDRIQKQLGRTADINANPFVALNSGFIRDGAYVFFPRGATLDQPIHLLFVDTGGDTPVISHPRILIVAEDNSEFALVTSFVGAGGQHFSNVVTEVVTGSDCRVDYTTLQHETPESFHVSTLQVKLGRASNFVSQAATLGGRVTRNDLNCVLAGEGAEATLNGLVIIGGEQHCDNHTLLDHASPNCPSHELYKHVLSGKSSGVFRGKILVRQIAQKTNSKQTSKSLLLSDDAYMNSQPALEIYADDVKCTHGSTVGPVDEDMMFYFRTRGVGKQQARDLLTYAFAADITRRIKIEPVRRRLEDFMATRAGLPQDLRITDLGAANEQHRT